MRGPKSAPVEGEHELFGFLTTEANAIVAPIHPKAMPVILTTTEEFDLWLEGETTADAQEDKLHRASRRGDEMPGWIADKQKRLAKIREAREALEAEAAAAAAAKAEAERAAEEKRKAENRKRSGPVPRPPSKEPDPKVQRNFTDPDSRVLLTKDGFIQGYNAQAAVDGPSKSSWRMD